MLLNAPAVLYAALRHARSGRGGRRALADQQAAAGIMWLAGDAIFLVAVMAIVVGWMRAEARDTGRADRRAAAEMADIRVREGLLADRLAREREDGQPGSGASR